MAPRSTRLAGLVPVGLQVMSLTNGTAIGLNSTLRAARVLLISVETNAARMRADGTAPALTTGVLFPKDVAPVRFEGYNGTALLKFQRTTGVSKVSIFGWKHHGD
jgi:hypothetical protein